MKYIFIFFLIPAVFSNCPAEIGIYAGIYYPVPQSQALRNEYQPAAPFLGLEFGSSLKIYQSLYLSLDVSYKSISMINNGGSSVNSSTTYLVKRKSTIAKIEGDTDVKDIVEPANCTSNPAGVDLTMHFVPITLSLNYFFNHWHLLVPYVGIGLTDYSVFYDIKYPTVAENGKTTSIYDKAIYKNGIGLVGNAGLNLRLTEKQFIGLGLRYDYTFLGKAENGGLENVGGFDFKANYFIFF